MGGGGPRNYSVNRNDYKLLEEVGYGASATVYRAIYLPFNEVIAVKCLDLDRCNSNLDDIRREAQTMSLIDHPNVIKSFCSFVVENYLWVVMPFMAEGSCLHLMKIAYPDGFEESAICSVLKETLKALEYLHQHGHIHRDVKAGNILLDTNGAVKLGDFGVSACMFDSGDRQRSRNTFVGTPCWMAPEVLQPGTGYDFKADIWSFGITALELAHGHAPFSKYPPMKVLLMTIQNAPPGLDYDRDKKFSKSFKEMVAMCLVKDQTKRPTAEKLLKHSFFKNAKPPELSVKKLFADLPPLWNRVKALQLKDAAQLALKRMPSSEQEALSQSEYQRGVSAWNFDLEDLKLQASLVQDDDEIQEIKGEDDTMKVYMNYKEKSTALLYAGKSTPRKDSIASEQESVGEVPVAEYEIKKGKDLESSPLDSDHWEKNGLKKNASKTELPPLTSDRDSLPAKSRTQTPKARQSQSGPLMAGAVLSHSASERARNSERSEIENQQPGDKVFPVRRAPSFSGPLMLPNRASGNSLSAPIKSSGGINAFKTSSFFAIVCLYILYCCCPSFICYFVVFINYHLLFTAVILFHIKYFFAFWDDIFEMRVFRKQPLYLYEVVVRSAYILPSPNPTSGIPLSMLLLCKTDNSLRKKSRWHVNKGRLLFAVMIIFIRSGFKDSLDDKSKPNLVQIKGRFSVTSENVDLVKDIPLCTVPRRSSQGSPLRKSASVGEWLVESKQMPPCQPSKELGLNNVPASVLMPHLQNLFQQTSIQQDLIVNLLSSLQLSEAGDSSQNGKLSPLQRPENNGTVEAAVSEREKLLLVKISELQARMINLTDELTAEKLKYWQLQQRLNAMSSCGEDGDRRELES